MCLISCLQTQPQNLRTAEAGTPSGASTPLKRSASQESSSAVSNDGGSVTSSGTRKRSDRLRLPGVSKRKSSSTLDMDKKVAAAKPNGNEIGRESKKRKPNPVSLDSACEWVIARLEKNLNLSEDKQEDAINEICNSALKGTWDENHSKLQMLCSIIASPDAQNLLFDTIVFSKPFETALSNLLDTKQPSQMLDMICYTVKVIHYVYRRRCQQGDVNAMMRNQMNRFMKGLM